MLRIPEFHLVVVLIRGRILILAQTPVPESPGATETRITAILVSENTLYRENRQFPGNRTTASYMWEAQAINMMKAPIAATGSVMMMAAIASTSVTGPLAALLYAGGALVSAAGNSINVNPTTGERSMKMTDQAAVNTGISMLAATAGGLGQYATALGKAGQAAQTVQAVANAGRVVQSFSIAASLAASTVRYDSEGRSQGMSLKSRHGDMHGESAALSMISTALTTAYGASTNYGSNLSNAIAGDAFGMALNVGIEYGKQQTWGKDKSGYDALGRPDAGRLGGLLTTVVQNAYKDAGAEAEKKAVLAEADKLAREGRKQQAVQLLVTMGYARSREDAEQTYGQRLKSHENDGILQNPENLGKLLHAATAADGRYGNQTSGSMGAAEQVGNAIRADIAALGKGGPLTNEVIAGLCQKYGVDPASLLTQGNVAMATKLYGQNYTQAYQAQLAKEAAASQKPAQPGVPNKAAGGGWGSQLLSAATRKLLGPFGAFLPSGELNATEEGTAGTRPLTQKEVNARALQMVKAAQSRKAGAEAALNWESNLADAASGVLRTPGGLVSTSVGLGMLALNPLAIAAKVSGAEEAVVNYLNELTRNEALEEARTDMFIEALTEQMARDPAGVPEFVKGYAHLSAGVQSGGTVLGETVATMGAGRLLGAFARYTAEFETMASRAWGQTGSELAALRWGQGSGGFSSQAAVVEGQFARYGGEAQRAALLSEVQQASTITEKVALIAKSRLQVMTNAQNAALAADLRVAQGVLSPMEYAAATRRPWLARMQYGNAVERLVANELSTAAPRGTPLLHVGGPGNPDFIGVGRLRGMNFDITTEAARAAHLARPRYGQGLNIITYERPPGFWLFPP